MGACTIHDILACDPLFEQRYTFTHYLGSISRTFHPIGKIAERLGNEIADGKVKPRDYRVKQMFNYITKEVTPSSLLQNVPPNTVIVIDYAYELTNFFFNQQELFDLISTYNNIKTFLPNWLYKEITKHTYPFDSGIQEIARHQYRTMKQFQTEIVASLNLPVIVFNNSFSKHIYDRKTNTVAEILEFPDVLPRYNRILPFKYSLLTTENEFMKYEYSQNLLNHFYSNIKKHLPLDVKTFDIASENVYADPDHKYGYHPVHYHQTCRAVLWSKLRTTILEAISDHKKRLISPNSKII